jgi:hypothetical protein
LRNPVDVDLERLGDAGRERHGPVLGHRSQAYKPRKKRELAGKSAFPRELPGARTPLPTAGSLSRMRYRCNPN